MVQRYESFDGRGILWAKVITLDDFTWGHRAMVLHRVKEQFSALHQLSFWRRDMVSRLEKDYWD